MTKQIGSILDDVIYKTKEIRIREEQFLRHYYNCKFGRSDFKLLWKSGDTKFVEKGDIFLYKDNHGDVKFVGKNLTYMSPEEVLDKYPEYAEELLFHKDFFKAGETNCIVMKLI
jgi:hypothetical protein